MDQLNLPENSKPGDGKLAKAIWEEIKFNISHVIQAAEPFLHYKSRETSLLYQYPRRNYGLYGFDIILDENAHAYCLEVNTLPSMETTTLFDQKLKFNLLQNAFEIIQPTVSVEEDENGNQKIVVPRCQEHEVDQFDSVAKMKEFSREKIIEWDDLDFIEQRAIAEITEAEKRLCDFERI